MESRNESSSRTNKNSSVLKNDNFFQRDMTLKLSKHYVTAAVISEIKSSTNHEEEDKYIQKQKEQSDSSSVSSSEINHEVTTLKDELIDMSPRELPKRNQHYRDYIHGSLTASTCLNNLTPIVHTFAIRK